MEWSHARRSRLDALRPLSRNEMVRSMDLLSWRRWQAGRCATGPDRATWFSLRSLLPAFTRPRALSGFDLVFLRAFSAPEFTRFGRLCGDLGFFSHLHPESEWNRV